MERLTPNELTPEQQEAGELVNLETLKTVLLEILEQSPAERQTITDKEQPSSAEDVRESLRAKIEGLIEDYRHQPIIDEGDNIISVATTLANSLGIDVDEFLNIIKQARRTGDAATQEGLLRLTAEVIERDEYGGTL